jgi:hypothetical protein
MSEQSIRLWETTSETTRGVANEMRCHLRVAEGGSNQRMPQINVVEKAS